MEGDVASEEDDPAGAPTLAAGDVEVVDLDFAPIFKKRKSRLFRVLPSIGLGFAVFSAITAVAGVDFACNIEAGGGEELPVGTATPVV